MEIKVEQLNILMNAIRDIVKNKNCPAWVSKRLADAVKNAKEYNSAQATPSTQTDTRAGYEIDYTYRPYQLEEYVVSNVDKDECLYQIIEQPDPINNVNLFTLRIITGNKNNPAGFVIHNVPETMLQHIKY